MTWQLPLLSICEFPLLSNPNVTLLTLIFQSLAKALNVCFPISVGSPNVLFVCLASKVLPKMSGGTVGATCVKAALNEVKSQNGQVRLSLETLHSAEGFLRI